MQNSETTKNFQTLVDNLSHQMRPTNYRDMLGLAAELWLACPPYRQAIIRSTSFFMTELEVTGEDGVEESMDEIRLARELLNRRFATTDQPLLVLQEALGFGGSCAYLQFPLNRVASCPCGATMPLASAMNDHSVEFIEETGKYVGPCAACKKKKVEFMVTDNRCPDRAQNARLTRIPLSLCRMNYNPITGERELYFDCSKWDLFAKGAKEGDPLFHQATHSMFIESARTGREVRMKDKFFHYIGFEDASLIDMQMSGWSLPPFFYAFPDVVAIMLLQKYNQVILSDYINPQRYVAPPATVGMSRNMGGSAAPFDPTHVQAGTFESFASKISGVVSALREAPGKTGVFPYPVEFGYMGLEGKQMLAPDMMQHYVDSLMWNMGVPTDFYRDPGQTRVAAPSNHRWTLYIRFWRPLVSNIDKMNQWIADRIAEAQRWPKLQVRLVPPVVQGSPEMIGILAQRNMEGKVSDETFDHSIGVDTEYERRAVLREQRRMEADMMDADRERTRDMVAGQMLADASPDLQAMQQLQMASEAALAPGAPPAAGGAPPVMAAPAPQPGMPQPPAGTPQSGINAAEQPVMDDVMAKAQKTAQDMMGMYRNSAERGAVLRTMEAQNPGYSALVQKAIEELENQARKQGLDQARGGMAGPVPV